MLRAAAGDAVETAIKTLKAVCDDVEAKPSDRASAATELGKLALQVLTKTRTGGQPSPGKEAAGGDQPDLFDGARAGMGPWKLTMTVGV